MREARSDQLIEDKVPVPGLRVDAILLYQKLHELQASQHDPPLLFIGCRASLVHKVHDAVNQLLDIHGRVSEQAYKCVQ